MIYRSGSKIRKLLSLGALLIAFSQQASADVPAEIQAIFVNNGCLGCHAGGNPSGTLSLADAATSEAELVGINDAMSLVI